MKLYDYTYNTGNCAIHDVNAYYEKNRGFYKVVDDLIDAQGGPLPGLHDITYRATHDKKEDLLCLSVYSAGVPVWLAMVCKSKDKVAVVRDNLRTISRGQLMDFPEMNCKLPELVKLPCVITYILPTARMVPLEKTFILGGVPRDFAIAYLTRTGE